MRCSCVRGVGLAASLVLSVISGLHAQGPRSFLVIHCEPQTASASAFAGLGKLVMEAEKRKIELTFEFSPQWAEMILLDAQLLATVKTWRGRGHEVGGHHHDVDHAGTWDGYSNTPPSKIHRREKYLGTMSDYKVALDRLTQAVEGENLRVGGLGTEEWPYGIPRRTRGARTTWLSRPAFTVGNQYGYWKVTYGFIETRRNVNQARAAYRGASANDVVGVVTHAHNFASSPQPILDWMDFVAAQDPTGARSQTVSEILKGLPDSLTSDRAELSVTQGGQVVFSLATNTTLGGHSYQMFVGLSGDSPGLTLFGRYEGNLHIGLNPDALTDLGIALVNTSVFKNFSGSLSSLGGATATFDTLGPLKGVPPGRELTFVFVAVDQGQFSYSSNPAKLRLVR